MTIQNTDILLVNRGNVSYKETYDNLIPNLDAVTTKGSTTTNGATFGGTVDVARTNLKGTSTENILVGYAGSTVNSVLTADAQAYLGNIDGGGNIFLDGTDGSAEFAGDVLIGTADTLEDTTNGVRVLSSGTITSQRQSTQGTSSVFTGMLGKTPTSSILADGSATFSGTVDAAAFTVSGSPISGGASVTVQSTAPTGASEGDLWWNDVDGRLFVYYTDSDGSQWVDASPEGYAYNDQDVNTLLNTSSAATGNILSWNGTDYDWIGQSSPTPGTGTIVQVQHTLKRDSWGTSLETYEKVPGLSVSITPTKANSKILISTSIFAGSSNECSPGLGLYRDNTILNQYAADTASLSGNQMITSGPFANMQYGYGPQCMQVLDSPNTTSTIVYSVAMFRNGPGTTQYINRRNYDSAQLGSSTITVMEIA